MSTILPPSLPLAAAQSAGQVLVPLTVADSASAAALSVLGQGTVIEGQVQGKAGSNQVTVTTNDAGTLTLQAKGYAADLLTPGTDVALQVVPGADGQLALRLIAVDGQAVARPVSVPGALLADLAPNPAVTDSAAASVPASSPAPQPPGLVATVIRAAQLPSNVPVVASQNTGETLSPAVAEPTPTGESPKSSALPAPPTAQTGGLPPDLPVGTTVNVRILDVGPPALSSPSAVTAQTPVLPADSALGDTAPVPATHTVGTVVLEAGQTETTPSPEPLVPETGSPSSLPVLEGKVLSTVPGQRATVATPVGVLSLPPVAALKPNVEVKFEVISAPVLPAQEDGEAVAQNADPIKILNDGMATLLASNENQALQQILSSVPQLDGRLAASLSLMVKAMDRQANKVDADGDETDDRELSVGEGTAKDAAGRMSSALKQMTGEVTQHAGQDGAWLGFKVPLDTGGLIAPVQFFIRQHAADDGRVQLDGDDKGSGGLAKNREQRFLVELMLSRLGPMQMDGLVQRTDKRFDLIVRTDQPLPNQMRSDITDLFITTTEAAGSRGTVTFQSGGRFLRLVKAGDPTKMSV